VLYGSGLGGAGRTYGRGGRRKSRGVGVGSKRARPMGGRSADDSGSGGFSHSSSSGDDSDIANVSGWDGGRRGGVGDGAGALLCSVASDEYPDMRLTESLPSLASRR